MEGSSNSGGQHTSYLPRLCACSSSSLCSVLSHFLEISIICIIHGLFRLLVWNYIVRRNKQQGFNFLIGTESRMQPQSAWRRLDLWGRFTDDRFPQTRTLFTWSKQVWLKWFLTSDPHGEVLMWRLIAFHDRLFSVKISHKPGHSFGDYLSSETCLNFTAFLALFFLIFAVKYSQHTWSIISSGGERSHWGCRKNTLV